jgi:diguanylate cyclase (GGDEF)-like protein
VAASRDLEESLTMVLSTIAEAFRFKRVVLFDIAERMLHRRHYVGEVTQTKVAVRPGSVLQRMGAGALEFFSSANELVEAPLRNVEGTYYLVPATSHGVVRGIIYADGAVLPLDEAQAETLSAFAAQAAIALEYVKLADEADRLQTESEQAVMRDPITGLANRRAFNEMLHRELSSAKRHGQTLAYAMIHLTGPAGAERDAATRRLGEILNRTSRAGDIAARYEGTEFALVMTQTDRAGAKIGIERIFAMFTEAALTCTVGLAMYPSDGDSAPTLLHSADLAVRSAEALGPNRYAFFTPAEPVKF